VVNEIRNELLFDLGAKILAVSLLVSSVAI
jgi:hypothetical protein